MSSLCQIVLASQSPRRAAILTQLGFKFRTFPVDEPDFFYHTGLPKESVKKVAIAKAKAAKQQIKYSWDIIIAADTVVCHKNEVIGKPIDEDDACRILKLLSGKEHKVFTGLVLLCKKNYQMVAAVEETRVTFSSLSEKEINSYVSTMEPLDKAGAYAIQGLGSFFVKKIEGCYYNVVGLPIYRLGKLLTKVGFPVDYKLLHPCKSLNERRGHLL